jgi:hypothetical protein
VKRTRIALFEGLDWAPTPIPWPPRVGIRRVPDAKSKHQWHSSRLEKRLRLRQDLYIKQQKRCWWCGQEMSLVPNNSSEGRRKANRMYATFEHLKPKGEGGAFDTHNIRLAHAACNEKRHRTNTPEWLVALYPVMYCWESFFARVGGQRDATGALTSMPDSVKWWPVGLRLLIPADFTSGGPASNQRWSSDDHQCAGGRSSGLGTEVDVDQEEERSG